MTTQHTPGPWRVEITSGLDGLPDYAVYQQAYRVASCNWRNELESGRKIAEANARLIAAAPELLAALNEAENASQELCHDQDPANECWAVLSRIRAAIAKATDG